MSQRERRGREPSAKEIFLERRRKIETQLQLRQDEVDNLTKKDEELTAELKNWIDNGRPRTLKCLEDLKNIISEYEEKYERKLQHR